MTIINTGDTAAYVPHVWDQNDPTLPLTASINAPVTTGDARTLAAAALGRIIGKALADPEHTDRLAALGRALYDPEVNYYRAAKALEGIPADPDDAAAVIHLAAMIESARWTARTGHVRPNLPVAPPF